MTSRRIRSLIFAGLAAAVAAGLAAPSAFAKPADVPASAALRSLPVTGAAGPAAVVFGPGRLSIPSGSPFRFECQVQSKKPLAVLQARLRLSRADGALVYQKTFVKHSVETSVVAFEWERATNDIGLAPAVYPVELGVDAEVAGTTTHASLPAALLIYDANRAQMPITLVARISAQPLSDPQGRFVSDPARFTRARDDAHRLADWVLGNPAAKVTVSLSPVMVREWLHISGGYQLIGAEGTVDVPATDPVAAEYAATLDSLRRAIQTGRLEVLSAGYGDPDLFELKGADLLEDLSRHYEFGRTALMESLSATPTAGTAPPRGVPEAALISLARADITYIVVPGSQAKRNGGQPNGGLYRAADSPLTALVADGAVSRAVAQSGTVEAVDTAFVHYLATPGDQSALPVLVDLRPGAADVNRVIAAGDAFATLPWAKLVTGAEAVQSKPKARVTFKGRKPDKDAPAQYWDRVAEGRKLADALASLLPSDDEAGPQVVRQSLVAAGSAWAGLEGDWAPATTGLAYAVSAIDSVNEVFGKLTLTASKITLAGSKGTLPVTISNKTDKKLRGVLMVDPGSGVKLQGPDRREVELDPGDNFVEIPVVLENAFAGDVEVRLLAGDAQIAASSVRVQGSYLDRLVIGGTALVLIAGLLIFVIRRVREVEAGEELIDPGQLTLDIAHDPAESSAESRSSQEEHAEDG